MTTAGRRSLHVLASVVVIVLLVLFARHVDWRAAAGATRGADARLLLLALACNQLSLVLKGVRWWVFLRPLGVHSLRLVLRATYAGASLNNLVVAQGGEAARILIVSRASGVAGARVASALALERVLDGISYLTLLGGATLLLDLPDVLMRWRTAVLGALAIALLALAFLGASSGSGTTIAAAAPSTRRVRSRLFHFASSIAAIASPSRLGSAMLLSLAAWSLQVMTYHTIALAAHLHVSLGASVAAMLAIGISFLIRATPGNVGVFQVIYAMTMSGFGVPRPVAVAAALLIQLVQVIPTVVIGTFVGYGFAGDARRTSKTRRPLVE
ncbi:hypothetical protein BH09GEM1_BH09GEM1_18640 [soil metagenome]